MEKHFFLRGADNNYYLTGIIQIEDKYLCTWDQYKFYKKEEMEKWAEEKGYKLEELHRHKI